MIYWESLDRDCKECGWRGTNRQVEVHLINGYMVTACPNCRAILLANITEAEYEEINGTDSTCD